MHGRTSHRHHDRALAPVARVSSLLHHGAGAAARPCSIVALRALDVLVDQLEVDVFERVRAQSPMDSTSAPASDERACHRGPRRRAAIGHGQHVGAGRRRERQRSTGPEMPVDGLAGIAERRSRSPGDEGASGTARRRSSAGPPDRYAGSCSGSRPGRTACSASSSRCVVRKIVTPLLAEPIDQARGPRARPPGRAPRSARRGRAICGSLKQRSREPDALAQSLRQSAAEICRPGRARLTALERLRRCDSSGACSSP